LGGGDAWRPGVRYRRQTGDVTSLRRPSARHCCDYGALLLGMLPSQTP